MITILTAVEKIHSGLKPTQKHIMMLLANFVNKDGEAIISSNRIIKSIGCSRSTFFSHIKELEDCGWLKREERMSPTGSRLSSLYRLNLAKIDDVTKSNLIVKLTKLALRKLIDAFKRFFTADKLKKIEEITNAPVRELDPPRPNPGPHIYINNNTNKYNNYSNREYISTQQPPRPQPKLFIPDKRTDPNPIPAGVRKELERFLKKSIYKPDSIQGGNYAS